MKKRFLSLIPIIVALMLTGCSEDGGDSGSTSVPPSTSGVISGEQVTLQSISLEGTYKVVFAQNEQFSHNGLQVRAYYSDTSNKLVTSYSITTPDMSSLGIKNVKVEYSEETISVNASYNIYVSEVSDATRASAKQAIQSAFNALDIDEYSSVRWDKIIDRLNAALQGIDYAITNADVETIKTTVINYFVNSPTASEIVEGTWFNEHSSEANYEFDRSDEGKLEITYDGYPGHWTYIGTRTNLVTSVPTNNLLTLKFSNDIDEAIGVCLQATNDSGSYKLDTGVVNVNAHEVKTLELRYDIDICKLYFFVDSVGQSHTRKGHITILETTLSYEDRNPTDYYPAKKVDMAEASLTKDNAGEPTKYNLKNEDNTLFIDRIDVHIKVNYHQNDNGHQYFGLRFYTGTNHISLGSADGHASDEKDSQGNDTGWVNYLFNVPVSSSSKLIPGEEIHVEISYAAGPDNKQPSAQDLTFKVCSYRFHYTLWRFETSEVVDVNQKVWEGGVGTGTLNVPYSSFHKNGRVNRMKINFTTVNNESYGKSQLYIKNFAFTEFSSGNNNVLNIGKIMNQSEDPTPTEGSMVVYPLNDIDLTENASIEFQCWWASATDITINSIEMFTDVVSAPEQPTNLVAHPIDSGVVVEWAKNPIATSYVVYKDGVEVDEVTRTSYKFTGLTNNQQYTFGVVAKNYAGDSSMATVNGTPQEGAEYDELIQNINTPLEELITQTRIDTMFDSSLTYFSKANNERFKSKLEAMESGTPTKIAFMGGSITVGETSKLKDERGHAKGYAYHTYQWLKQQYDKHDVSEFINASISGTGSEIGIVRAQKDVLNHNPDIIFLEFAANNGSSDLYKQTYESLIRKFLALPSNPAIVLVFSATYYSGSSEAYMVSIGEHYHLPMFTFDKALKAICVLDDNGNLSRDTDQIYHDFSDDGTHPNDNGHLLYAKCLANFCKQLYIKDKDSAVAPVVNPSQAGYDKYEGLVSVDNTYSPSPITSLGSFVATNTKTPSTGDQSDVTAFQQGWKKTTTTANEPMVLSVNAKNFILIYEAGNPSRSGDPTGNIIVHYQNNSNPSDEATFTWDVSKTYNQNDMNDLTDLKNKGNGWQNPVGLLIFDKDTAANYTITIQMEDNAGIATIMAFGYTA